MFTLQGYSCNVFIIQTPCFLRLAHTCAHLRTLALFVAIFTIFTHAANAQQPDLEPVDWETESTVNPNTSNKCELAYGVSVQSSAIVHLSNGQILAEIVISSLQPYTGPMRLNTPQATYMALVEISNGGSTRRYQWTGLVQDDVISFEINNPCAEENLVIHTSMTGCDPLDMVSVSPQFLEDYSNWTSNVEQGNDGGNLISFLNSLTYLTDAQRWSFFQRTAMDCDLLDVDEVYGLIPDSKETYLSECDCQSVLMSKEVSDLSVPFTGFGQVTTSTNPYHNGGGVGEFRYYYTDIEGGASKNHNLEIMDWRGSQTAMRDYARSDSTRRSTITLLLACLLGEQTPGDPPCECTKRVDVRYDYRADLRLAAEDWRPKGRYRLGGATLLDAAWVGFQEQGGDFVLQDISVQGDALDFEVDFNSDWGDAIGSLIGNLAAIALVVTDTSTANIQGVPFALQAGQDIGTLINEDRLIFSGTSGERNLEHTLNPNGSFEVTLNPNKRMHVSLYSADYQRVRGRHSYHVLTHVQAGHMLSAYLPSSDRETEEGCCTQHGFAYVSKQLGPASSPSGLYRGLALAHATQTGFTGSEISRILTNDAGGLSRDNSRDGLDYCNDVFVESLILKNRNTVSFSLFDQLGRTVYSFNRFESPNFSLIEDGSYFLSKIESGGEIITSKPIVISGGISLTSLSFE